MMVHFQGSKEEESVQISTEYNVQLSNPHITTKIHSKFKKLNKQVMTCVDYP